MQVSSLKEYKNGTKDAYDSFLRPVNDAIKDSK